LKWPLMALLATSPNAACEEGEKTVTESIVEEIEETTVGMLGGHRVPMGSMIREADYTLADGTKKRGMVCSLIIDGQTGVFVGLGSTVQVGEKTWEVIAIEKAPKELGSVKLRMR
jgi:hypothetical protein